MKIVLALAALGISTTGAFACDYQKSAQAESKTVVADATTVEPAMSTVADALPESRPAPVVAPKTN